jgi:hypothetical protein
MTFRSEYPFIDTSSLIHPFREFFMGVDIEGYVSEMFIYTSVGGSDRSNTNFIIPLELFPRHTNSLSATCPKFGSKSALSVVGFAAQLANKFIIEQSGTINVTFGVGCDEVHWSM